jgi:hypothetical protein
MTSISITFHTDVVDEHVLLLYEGVLARLVGHDRAQTGTGARHLALARAVERVVRLPRAVVVAMVTRGLQDVNDTSVSTLQSVTLIAAYISSAWWCRVY